MAFCSLLESNFLEFIKNWSNFTHLLLDHNTGKLCLQRCSQTSSLISTFISSLPFPHFKFNVKILHQIPNKFLHVSWRNTWRHFGALYQSPTCLMPPLPGPPQVQAQAWHSVGQRPLLRVLWDNQQPFCCCYCIIIDNEWLGLQIQMPVWKQTR